MKRHNTTAPTSAKLETRFDPSTWANQPRLLAKNEAEARLYQMAPWAALIALGIALASFAIGENIRLPIPWPLAMLALWIVELAGLASIYASTYASALQADNQAARRATWHIEQQTGHDLDGDGHIGPPEPIGHIIPLKSNGQDIGEIILADLDAPGLRPLAGFPAEPKPITPNDVIYIIDRAAEVGLGSRQWEGHHLPSGASPGRDVWTAILDGLLLWQFATQRHTSDGRRLVELRTDTDIEHMKAAIQKAIGEDSPPPPPNRVRV